MIAFTSDQWVIVALIFLLGLLIGAFLTAGGRRKWKARYRDESARREALERENRDREAQWASREKELAARDTAAPPRAAPAARDSDADGVRDDVDRRPTDDRRA